MQPVEMVVKLAALSDGSAEEQLHAAFTVLGVITSPLDPTLLSVFS